nr:SAM-dependent chlorinase/fluorinase [Desulfobaculum xiamenense]
MLSDFGTGDPYVAQMKGAILRINPDALIVDVTHGIEPFNLAQGGFHLNATRPHFPQGTIFVAVVDPGVGGTRRIVLLEKDGQRILAPDNGLLGLVLAAPGEARAFDMSAHIRARADISHTFHGRDVFAPLAARLALGEAPESLGPQIPVDALQRLDWAAPQPAADRRAVSAVVLHVDRFGNCILNIPDAPWFDTFCAWSGLALSSRRHSASVVCAQIYSNIPLGALGLMRGSQGYLELSMNQASAARLLSATCGTRITLSATDDAS